MTDAENTKPQEEQPVIPPKPEDAIPDGIGLSLEQVQELLAKTHKKVVDYHDPILMVVTMLNAHLAEVEKLQARHKEGLGRLMADRTDAYVSGVAAAVGQLTDSLSSFATSLTITRPGSRPSRIIRPGSPPLLRFPPCSTWPYSCWEGLR